MKPKFSINLFIFLIMMLVSLDNNLLAQIVVHPKSIKKPVGFAISGPLRNNPIVSYTDLEAREIPINRKINPNIQLPDYSKKLPAPGEQTEQGPIQGAEQIIYNYAGQNTNLYPPDANGDVNGTYYFQTVNSTYAIFDKSNGSIVAGPSALNSIFDPSLPGAEYNDGDPVVLWDEHAQKWLFMEFSLSGSNDYMLIAVSTTDDPTGTWYSWSFDVDDMPDYPKIGIWQDGYYMATNTPNGNDVYVFERDAMIAGDSDPTMISFDNPNRPSTFDNFHCILPLDNDGPWAPLGTHGQYITIADDGQGNPSDALYIYELDADWSTPANSTFSRTQTLNVNSFSGNFNSSWSNIPQPGTSQKLDGLSTILMHRAQYRNFDGVQKIVCAHTIAESSSEAAIRWYELENTGTEWAIAQQGTYNPDGVSRWCPSIAMNNLGQIAMAYSVSDGSNTYPGIRYCGQTNSAPSGVMDVEETVIWDGNYSQTNLNRWGDYSNMSIDPTDGKTFWFTSQYKENGTDTKGTRIAAFSLGKEVTLDQQREDGTSLTGTTIGRWNGSSFDDITITNPLPKIKTASGSQEVLRGYQQLVTSPNEKYRVWERNQVEQLENVKNHRAFTIATDDENLTSRFHPSHSGISITNYLLSAQQQTGDSVKFKDPWLIDYADPDYGNNKRNQGMSAPFKSRQSPFSPDYTTSYNGDVYQGVFLGQGYNQGNWAAPYYSVKASPSQTATAHGETVSYSFDRWGGTGVQYQYPDNEQTPVVFNSASAVAEARYKGHLASSTSTATGPNGSRVVARSRIKYDGYLYGAVKNIFTSWPTPMAVKFGTVRPKPTTRPQTALLTG